LKTWLTLRDANVVRVALWLHDTLKIHHGAIYRTPFYFQKNRANFVHPCAHLNGKKYLEALIGQPNLPNLNNLTIVGPNGSSTMSHNQINWN
jgi:hypothetical protein